MKGPQFHYDEVEMGPHSKFLAKPHSKFTADAQYEECRNDVTSSDLPMEENPAYQSVDVHSSCKAMNSCHNCN